VNPNVFISLSSKSVTCNEYFAPLVTFISTVICPFDTIGNTFVMDVDLACTPKLIGCGKSILRHPANNTNTTNENLQMSLQEYCADVEISKDNLNIRQHQDFYENNEISSFLVIPSEDYTEPYDEYYLINKYNFGYKNFEQDRNTKNTIKSFHTNAEWLPKNERSDKDKKIEIDLVRDPFLKQATFNLAIKNPNTSTEKDEKLFIEDIVPLAPNSFREFTRTLLMRWQDNKLEILNRNTLGTNENSVLNWNNFGLAVGASFQILSGANIGNYTIDSIKVDGSVIFLIPIGSIAQASGNYTIRIKHFYSNVNWQTRTTEDFSIAPTGYSNLAYTIKRNIYYWYYYLATATMYCKKDIQNSFFKNFGKLETQLDSETTPVIEDAPIIYADLLNYLLRLFCGNLNFLCRNL